MQRNSVDIRVRESGIRLKKRPGKTILQPSGIIIQMERRACPDTAYSPTAAEGMEAGGTP
ncbi:MAG: hypothetical protein IPL08_13445 [Saprospiraceae bacterium]|nr:hypothetical protein [Saprospiraceae bacterium]